MKLLLLFAFLGSALAAFGDIFTQFLLMDRYGRNNNNDRRQCRWVAWAQRYRCHREENNNGLAALALYSLLKPPAPAPTPGCYPNYATFERQTSTGDFETVHANELVIGDKVKCLKAPLGPATTNPELGLCRFMSDAHNTNDTILYEQIYYEEDGETKMMALTQLHQLWRSHDRTLQGPIDAKAIAIQNKNFGSAINVSVGDVIVALDRNNVLQYRTVTDRRLEFMDGVHNPYFSDGGLPIVNGVVSTTTPTSRTGHWDLYFTEIWQDDAKFTDAEAVHDAWWEHPFYVGQRNGSIIVDNEGCFVPHIIADLKKGVDVSNYDSYDAFAKVYMMPCATTAPVADLK
jgi:hypothetical protein